MSELIEKAKAYRAYVEASVQDRPDEEAIHFINLHPFWKPDMTAIAGNRYQYNGKLFRCSQTHLTQEGWEPGTDTASLFTEINEAQAGSLTDPIPYNGNMLLEKGKYYSQDSLIYRCIRDTGIAVYSNLADLVGNYVEVA